MNAKNQKSPAGAKDPRAKDPKARDPRAKDPKARDLRAKDPKKEKTGNPNRRRSLYIGNIIFLSLLTIASLLFALVVFFRVRAQGTDGFRKFYSDRQIENIKEAAAEKERNALRLQIQSSLESGRSTTQMLRELFDESIVVMSGGRYYFYPTLSGVEKNPLAPGTLSRVGETVTYAADSPEVTISHGILLRDANGKVDWNRLADSRIEEVVIRLGKVTERGFVEDQQCERNCRKAVEKEMRAFLCVDMDEAASEEAIEQAGYAADVLFAQYGKRTENEDAADGAIDPVVLIRLNPVQELADDEEEKKSLTEAVRYLCKDLKERDLTPVLGGTLFTFAARIDLSGFADCDRWLIDHEETASFPYSFSFWEYSAEGRTEGVPGGALLYARVTVREEKEPETEPEPAKQ